MSGLNVRLRVALVADAITRECLSRECEIRDLTPLNYRFVLALWKPDLVLVESAWQGLRDRWKFRIAAYPDHPRRNNRTLAELVSRARDRGIPCVFWSKEDGVHFERFIDSAKLFDHVFTVDESSIPRYRAVMGAEASVHPLMFAVQPRLHRFRAGPAKVQRACFVGSYSRHIHDRRRERQDMLLEAASSTLGLTVFDRNSGRRGAHYRYPVLPGCDVRPAVPHAETARIYQDHLVSLNVNTVEDSPTMLSRRLLEILACGSIAVTTPALAVERWFGEYCHVVSDRDGARELLSRLARGPSVEDCDRAEAGARHVAEQHTWAHRLDALRGVVGV